MRISIIAAIDRHGLIGTEAGLPWHLPADLKRFRALTWGKPILMGRTTHERIGRPLPGRLNIVLTRDLLYEAPGCRVAASYADALVVAADHLAEAGGDEVMVIGGGKVYAEAIHHWDRLYLTVVEGEFKGTAYFPLRELLGQRWRPVGELELHPADAKNPHPHSFHILERVGDRAVTRAGAGLEELPEGLDLVAVLRRGTDVA
jgi:dihydrofolate reductase